MVNFEEKLPPEILIENVMSYTIQATEVLKQKPDSLEANGQRFLFIPDGPHYYTGILQAMGYLITEKFFKNKKNLIIFSNSDSSKHFKILQEPTSYLWQERDTQTTAKKLIKNHEFVQEALSSDKKLKSAIRDQLIFVRTLIPHHNIMRATMGKACPWTHLSMLFNDTALQGFNIIIIGQLHENINNENCMDLDKDLITTLLLGKSIASQKNNFPGLYCFSKLCKDHEKQPEIIAYLNSCQMWADDENCTGYACIVA